MSNLTWLIFREGFFECQVGERMFATYSLCKAPSALHREFITVRFKQGGNSRNFPTRSFQTTLPITLKPIGVKSIQQHSTVCSICHVGI